MFSGICVSSKATLAACVPLQIARMPLPVLARLSSPVDHACGCASPFVHAVVRCHMEIAYRYSVPPGTYVLDLCLSVLCMRSKAWLAARVSHRLARLPRTASSAQRSRRLRSTRAAAPVLLAHAEVTKNITFSSIGPKLRYSAVHS